MARKFRFKGLPKPPYVKKMGKILKIKMKGKNGVIEFTPSNPALGFMPNDVLDLPDDERIIRHMKSHPHFDEVL